MGYQYKPSMMKRMRLRRGKKLHALSEQRLEIIHEQYTKYVEDQIEGQNKKVTEYTAEKKAIARRIKLTRENTPNDTATLSQLVDNHDILTGKIKNIEKVRDGVFRNIRRTLIKLELELDLCLQMKWYKIVLKVKEAQLDKIFLTTNHDYDSILIAVEDIVKIVETKILKTVSDQIIFEQHIKDIEAKADRALNMDKTNKLSTEHLDEICNEAEDLENAQNLNDENDLNTVKRKNSI